MFKYLLITLLATCLAPSNGELVCPSDEVMYPCDCVDSTFKWIRCNGANVTSGEQIKEVLDRISPLIDEDVIFEKLWITDTTELTEIPAGVISSLKFQAIEFRSNAKLRYVSPDAFPATQNVTTEIQFMWQNSEQNGTSSEWVFKFLNAFPNVTKIVLQELGISSIPDYAFDYLPNLERIEININPIKKVGAYPFSNLPKLNTVWITNNGELTIDSFSPNSFKNFSSPEVWVGLDWSDNLKYLPEETIKPIFDTGRRLTVGGATCSIFPLICTYRRLVCDSNIDWICDHPNKKILEGYYCNDDSVFDDIEKYCLWTKQNVQSK